MSLYLQKDNIEDFKTFLFEQGVPYRDGRGEWQVLQFRDMSRRSDDWFAVYRSDKYEDYKVDKRAHALMNDFHAWERAHVIRP